nr:MAG TPA: hypothetical protein [Caudoviricetes sp.]
MNDACVGSGTSEVISVLPTLVYKKSTPPATW